MTKIFLYEFLIILININVYVNCSEVTDNQNQEQQNNTTNTLTQQSNNNQVQDNNIQSMISIILQKINRIEEELKKSNALIQEQQDIIRRQKEEESEKINKVFNDLQNTKIVAIQHSDGTTTLTSRSDLKVSKKALPQRDTTMVPTNIIKPTL